MPGIKLFSIRGIKISIDYSWFVIFLLVFWSLSAGYLPRSYPGYGASSYWLVGFIATFLFFTSIFIHELTHSFMALHLGIKIPEITFFIFGGVSKLSQDAKTPQSEFKIAIVGPLSSFVLAAVFWMSRQILAANEYSLVTAVLSYLVWINVALGIFNLVPGFPLDGGRVLRSLIWMRTGSLTRATRSASAVGRAFGTILMILGGIEVFLGGLIGGLWFFFIGLFLRGMATAGYQELIVRKSLEGVHVKELMIENMVTVPYDTTIGELIREYFYKYHYRGFPVAKDGAVLGVVSLQDIKNIPAEEHDYRKIEEVMRPLDDTNSISSHSSLAEALNKMTGGNASRLLVTENSRVTGMITKASLMRFLEMKSILRS